MLIMELPRSKDIFKEVQFDRETKEKLYDPKDVISLIHIGTQIYGFDLSQEKIEKVIKDFVYKLSCTIFIKQSIIQKLP